ncbi:MAG: acyltransferase [Chitinophagaceae bacterium]|nr:acyltransferase [Chitinophagaceae bacterium]
MSQAPAAFADSKQHYPILDGLRGVAAVMVVIFHIFETFAGGNHSKQIINHGYLAVDFFFLLSGFVIGYAYDDRWHKMTLTGFFKRRLIRLHPMIVMGMVIGAILFYPQAGPVFPSIVEIPAWKMLLIMLFGFSLLPLPTRYDIRGWSEMHPLNGPAWSLFFEYIANILYALVLRKLPNVILGILVVLAGANLLHYCLTGPNGDVIGGWSLEPLQLRIGFTRLLYPFLAGLLLSRLAKPGKLHNAFTWSSLILVLVLAWPRVGSDDAKWVNGLYDALVILLVFPAVVYMGASGQLGHGLVSKISRFLGDISYPIYIIHYPFIYWYTNWAIEHDQYLFGSTTGHIVLVLVSVAVLLVSVLVAYLCLKLYDVPVRRWLTRKWM